MSGATRRTPRRRWQSLEEVSRRFPGTPYAQDAEAKAMLARDHLAGKEMEVGRYYDEEGLLSRGINRFKRVVTDYQTTSHTPEALYRLTECYMALGVRVGGPDGGGRARPQLSQQPVVQGRLCAACRPTASRRPRTRSPGSAGPGSRSIRSEPSRSGFARLGYKGAMLTALSIRDIVLIEKLDISLEDGLTVLTRRDRRRQVHPPRCARPGAWRARRCEPGAHRRRARAW